MIFIFKTFSYIGTLTPCTFKPFYNSEWVMYVLGNNTTGRRGDKQTERVREREGERKWWGCSTVAAALGSSFHHSQPKSWYHTVFLCHCLFPDTHWPVSSQHHADQGEWESLLFSASPLCVKGASGQLFHLNLCHLSCECVIVLACVSHSCASLEGRYAGDGITRGNQLHFLFVREK